MIMSMLGQEAKPPGQMIMSMLGVKKDDGVNPAAEPPPNPPPEAPLLDPAPVAHEVAAEHDVATAQLLAEFARQAAKPWSVAELETLDEEARDSMLGEKLYTLISILEPARAELLFMGV